LAKPPPRPYRRKLSNYLLNKSLQLRYVVLVTALSAIIAGVLGYLIWRQEADASAHVLEAFDSLGMEDQELRAEILDRTSTDDQNLVLTMAGVGLGLMAVLFFYLVIMTHKVAGPLFKVTRYFDEMAAGRLGRVYSLRKGDMLRDFYDKFRDMHDSLRARHAEDVEAMGRFLAACEAAGIKGGELERELAEMRALLDRRKQALA
jgi:nitrogen fixation/metabolism regulation signal transduction histidine kinase